MFIEFILKLPIFNLPHTVIKFLALYSPYIKTILMPTQAVLIKKNFNPCEDLFH